MQNRRTDSTSQRRRLAALPLVAALFSAPAAASWQTLVVEKEDTASSLFSANGIALRHLARLTRMPKIARTLSTLRAGDILEVRREGSELTALRLYSGTRHLDITANGDGWKVKTRALDKATRTMLAVRKLERSLAARLSGAATARTTAATGTAPANTTPAHAAPTDTVAAAAQERPAAAPASQLIATERDLVSQAIAAADDDAPPAALPTGIAARILELDSDLTQRLSERDGERDLIAAVAEQLPVVRSLEDGRTSTTARPNRVGPGGSPLRLTQSVRRAERDGHARRLSVLPPVLMPLEPVPAALRARTSPLGRPSAVPALARAVRKAELAMAKRRLAFRTPNPIGRSMDSRVAKVLSGARGHIGVPYLWGGNSPETGFDCSGFVVYHLKKVGLRVPRTAHQQFKHTRTKPVPRNKLAPGDLVFFRDAKRPGRIGHVGIYIGKDRFIHAVGEGKPVQITPMSRPHYARRFVRGGRILG